MHLAPAAALSDPGQLKDTGLHTHWDPGNPGTVQNILCLTHPWPKGNGQTARFPQDANPRRDQPELRHMRVYRILGATSSEKKT